MTNSKTSGGNQRGMSLIEMMVAIAVLGIVIGTASTFFVQMNQQSRIEYLKEMQQKLAADVENALSNPDAIANTVKYGSNSYFNNCSTPGKTCITTEPPGKQFVLYDTQSPPQQIAGPAVGFNTEGDRCTMGGADPKCAFNAIVTFWATCELDGANAPKVTCTKPGYLNFKYEIIPIHSEHKKKMSSYPERGNATSNKVANVVRMRLTDMLIRQGHSCGPGEMLLGFDNQGKAQCECLVQKTVWDGKKLVPLFAGAKKICGDQKCPKDTLMTGYQEVTTGGKKSVVPRCRSEASCSTASPPVDCPCKIVDLNTVGDCGPGFWMVSIDYGYCEATTDKNGKGAPETVKCENRTGRCCSFEQQ